eukprot:COSAG06_NODE_1618_length_8914_cov_10.299830_6_plen_78_part_00
MDTVRELLAKRTGLQTMHLSVPHGTLVLESLPYLLRDMLVYKPKDLNWDWSPHFSTLWDQNGWIGTKTAGNWNAGVS